jgi:hypothetical protein
MKFSRTYFGVTLLKNDGVLIAPLYRVCYLQLRMEMKPTRQHYTYNLYLNGNINMFWKIRYSNTGPGSSIGIVTGYGLDGPGIESRWGRDFPHMSRPALGPTQPPVQGVRVFLGGRMRPGHDADPSPLLVSRSKNRVELYLYSP